MGTTEGTMEESSGVGGTFDGCHFSSRRRRARIFFTGSFRVGVESCSFGFACLSLRIRICSNLACARRAVSSGVRNLTLLSRSPSK